MKDVRGFGVPIAVVLLILLAFAMTACGGGDYEPEPKCVKFGGKDGSVCVEWLE
jgi:hypothetical protein